MKYLKKAYQNRIPYHSTMIEQGIILNANESPYPLPKLILDDFIEQIKKMNLNRYPDTDATILVDEIAKTYHLKSENIACGVGSDSLIDCIMKAVLEEGDIVLTVAPTFSMYSQYAELYGGKIYEVPLETDFSYNVDKIIKSIKQVNPKIVVLCNPNNPTGSVLRLEEVKRILKETSALVLLDEAYFEFYQEKESGISLLQDENHEELIDHLIVLRTFSKAYGFAGGRIGYLLASKENVQMVNIVKAPYFVNSMTLALATSILKHKELYQENIKNICLEREEMYQKLLSLKIKVYPSKSNFLWMKLDENIINELEKNQIYIRKMMYQNEKYYRISIGSHEENEQLWEVISSCVKLN